MKEHLARITKSLAFRILAPAFVIAFMAGLVIYIFVLRSISDFAYEHIKNDLSDSSLGVYKICDKSLTDLLMSGLSGDKKYVRLKRALTIGNIEDYMIENELKGAVIENERELLRVGDFSPEFLKAKHDGIKEHTVLSLKYVGRNYYAIHSHFEPWDWHFVLIKDTAAYSGLMAKVKDAYRAAAILFFIIICLALYFINNYIRYPINAIINPVRKGERPEYKGISEFEFLSSNIAQTMEALQNETDMINNLYRIAVSKKGMVFLDKVTKTVNKMFGLNSLIAKVNADGETATVIAMHYEGGIKNGKSILLKDIICKRGHTGKDVCVIETDAYKKFPSEYLTAIKADLYMCCNIFDTKDNIIGVVTAFGKHRELTDLDIKIFHAIGQMVAAEFERFNEEKEKEALREQLFHMHKLEAIGTLAGGIAHDFNNMLQGILGYAAFLKMKLPEDDPMYKPLSVIEHSAERAADLTKKLLGFARKGKYITEPLDLNTIVADVAAIITKTFDRSINIQMTLNPNLSTIEGDKSQIEHVILNLCLNSRDAMPEGGVLSIETANAEISEEKKPYGYMKEGKYVVLKVADTGKGMDKETRKRIFEPFFTTKEVGKGTGMGLPMAYGVVKNHNGFITVDSALGKGSTFTIYLPAMEEKAEKEAAISKPPAHGKGTILVVDDEEMVRAIARDTLQELGYNALLASNGKEAVAVYADKKYSIDLVILDMVMPEMGGKETFKKLKEINPDVKVIIVSGYGKDSFAEQVLDDGEAGFIQKPYNIKEIAEEIKEILYAD